MKRLCRDCYLKCLFVGDWAISETCVYSQRFAGFHKTSPTVEHICKEDGENVSCQHVLNESF